jgi:parallel beta-helix repeat protein
LLLSHGSNSAAYNNIIRNQGGSCGWGIQLDLGVSGAKVYNNTIYANRGAGIYIGNSSNAVVKNNIVYLNGGGTITNLGSATTLSNNLTTDPIFVSPDSADFRLQSSSQAIDRGAILTEVSDDMDGTPRPQGTSWDIGAYEYK